jgi:segregation and condensation protein A
VERLLEYERFKNASESLKEFEEERRKVFWRITDDLQNYDAPVMPLNLEAMDLLFALQQMLADVGEGTAEVTSIERQKVSLRIKMREIWGRIKSAPDGLGFRDLVDDPGSRMEIVMTFLAILELLRQGKITARQKKALGEINIQAVKEQ